MDATKLGRVSNSDLSDCVDLLSTILSRKPETSAGIVIAPHLISEKVGNGLRGELRTESCWFLDIPDTKKSLAFGPSGCCVKDA